MYSELIYEYELILCGERKQFHSGYIMVGIDAGAVRRVLHYAMEEILEWEPSEMARKFTPEIASSLALGNIISKIPFPPGLDHGKDYFYFAEFLYPGTCTDAWKAAALKYYTGFLKRPPRRGSLGCPREHKDIYLFNYLEYALSNLLPESVDGGDTEALYMFFSSDGVDGFLSKAKLSDPCALQYLYPVDMLHAYLRAKGSAVSPDLYPYYRFRAFMKANMQALPMGNELLPVFKL